MREKVLTKVEFSTQSLLCAYEGSYQSLPSGRALEHGGMCLLVAQTIASEWLLGGGGGIKMTHNV